MLLVVVSKATVTLGKTVAGDCVQGICDFVAFEIVASRTEDGVCDRSQSAVIFTVALVHRDNFKMAIRWSESVIRFVSGVKLAITCKLS